LTVAQFLNDWAERLLPGTVSARTEDIYLRCLRYYIVPRLGEVRLSKLPPAHVSGMLLELERDGFAPEIRRLARAVLRRALRRAEQEGLIGRNVASIADGPRIPKREGRTLTPEQGQAFLRAVRGNRLEAAYLVALALGLRRGEVIGLSWTDVSLEGQVPILRVERQLVRHRGGLRLMEVKTAGSRRTLHLPQPVIEALRAQRARQAAERLSMEEAWRNDSGLVFTTPMGTPLDPENFGHTVPRICEAAGLGRWTLHELRHSCASLLIAMGVPLEVVSETLGHSSIRVTKDVYGHLLAPARAAAADAMARALWSTGDSHEGDMATNLATRQELEATETPLTRRDVGRPELVPGTSPYR
jgi:integrase